MPDGGDSSTRLFNVLLITSSSANAAKVSGVLERGQRVTTNHRTSGVDGVTAFRKYGADVVLLDVGANEEGWLTTITRLRKLDTNMIIVMFSVSGSDNRMRAETQGLTHGAADYIALPKTTSTAVEQKAFEWRLVGLVHALGTARRQMGDVKPARRTVVEPKDAGGPATGRPKPRGENAVVLRPFTDHKADVIAIASSTGGPRALIGFFAALPRDLDVPILITQHMPKGFTSSLAQTITQRTAWPCHEGVDGMEVLPGYVYLAPGGVHMTIDKGRPHPRIRIIDTPPENFCKPAADPMFRSIAAVYGANAVALIFTGMGTDGCEGARKIADLGGNVIAQDEETSVVWGMPGTAAKAGICATLAPVDAIANETAKVVRGRKQ